MTTQVAGPAIVATRPPIDAEAVAATKQYEEYEGLLEEKSEVIRDLHTQIQTLKERITELETPSSADAPDTQELIAITEQLRQEQLQLKEDEQALSKQMCDMEIQMSR